MPEAAGIKLWIPVITDSLTVMRIGGFELHLMPISYWKTRRKTGKTNATPNRHPIPGQAKYLTPQPLE
jgi:hypothetical protein